MPGFFCVDISMFVHVYVCACGYVCLNVHMCMCARLCVCVGVCVQPQALKELVV